MGKLDKCYKSCRRQRSIGERAGSLTIVRSFGVSKGSKKANTAQSRFIDGKCIVIKLIFAKSWHIDTIRSDGTLGDK